MGYEIWDRDDRALVADFASRDAALDYLRDIVRELKAEAVARELDPLQLLRVTDAGKTQEVVSEGVALLNLIFAPAIAH
jgi:hypothetical protein